MSVDTTTDLVSTSDIAGYCARYCHDHHIDLVIKAGHRSESLVYTPLDWQLIRELPCPIIVAVDHELTQERKLLVALDIHSNNPGQQQLDRKVLAWAGPWADANDFTVYIASCIEAPEPLTSSDVEMLMDLETRMRPQVEPTIRSLLEELSISCKGILVSAGSTDVVLQRLAEELNADLVVMGYTARHGLGNLLIGHTAEKVMHRLDRNLAVVQSHAED
jgi:universal stress protein E